MSKIAEIVTGYKELEVEPTVSTWIEKVTYARASKTLTVKINGTTYAYHGVGSPAAEQVFEGVKAEIAGEGYRWSRQSHGKAMHQQVLGQYEYEVIPVAA